MVKIADWRANGGRLGSVLRECLAAAAAAPSVHNTQPWRFRPIPDGVDLLADHSRRLAVIDPAGRQLLISVGAALFNLKVAVAAHGRLPIVRLFPEPDDLDLVARVTFGAATPPSASVHALALAIPRRHTNRRGFSAVGLPPEVVHDLREAARVEGQELTTATPDNRESLLCLVRLAEHLEVSDPAYRAELGEWTRPWWRRGDGVPPQAYGPWSAVETVPIRDFGLVKPPQRRRTETFEDQPTIAVLYSPADSTWDWVVTGQALQRTLLTATTHGVSCTLMTQPLEIAHLRELMTDADHMPQAIIRFGYGPPSGTTPRRPVEEVLDPPATG